MSEKTYFRWRKEYGGLKLDQVRRMKELEQANARLRKAVSDLAIDNQFLKEVAKGNFLSPARRRAAVAHVRAYLPRSERRICRALAVHRSSLRYIPQPREDEVPLTQAVLCLASHYGRYGYRRVTDLLNTEGWSVSRSRIERICKRVGFKVPQKEPRQRRRRLAGLTGLVPFGISGSMQYQSVLMILQIIRGT